MRHRKCGYMVPALIIVQLTATLTLRQRQECGKRVSVMQLLPRSRYGRFHTGTPPATEGQAQSKTAYGEMRIYAMISWGDHVVCRLRRLRLSQYHIM
jgi:hypothetical protein